MASLAHTTPTPTKLWNSCSMGAAAQLVGLRESVIHKCIHAGLIQVGIHIRPQLSFQDLALLRKVKSLKKQGATYSRIIEQLVRIQKLSNERPLSHLPIHVAAGNLVVSTDDSSWHVASGQLLLPLTDENPGADIIPFPVPAPQAESAEEWAEYALELEETNVSGAINAYKEALKCKPDWSDVWLSLGHLYAENDDPKAATDCFGKASELDPQDPTAFYNLGVVLQDTGNLERAKGHYHKALEMDPSLAEAHYNLATVYDRMGEAQLAIRHINEFRRLNNLFPAS